MTHHNIQWVDRRGSFRLDMEKELIDISWQDNTGTVQEKKVVCLDFSNGGLKFESDIAFDINSSISVIFNARVPQSQKLESKVIRCSKLESGWFEVAVKLEKNCKK